MKRNVWRSLLCLVLVLVLVTAPLCAFASAKTAKILKVNVDKARLRDGPSGEIIAKLDEGTKLLYLNKTSKSYCKVSTANGTVGYIYKDYLSSYGVVRQNQVYKTSKATTLYRRSGNSLRKSSSLKKGQYLLVYKTNKSWAYVKSITGRSGYVKLNAIKKVF